MASRINPDGSIAAGRIPGGTTVPADDDHIPGVERRRDWRGAARALRRLLANGDDTEQVFKIMRALNADVGARNYRRLIETPGGGAIAYRRVELVERFSDPEFIGRFAPGTVGAAYRDFLASTGYSAAGLAEVSLNANADRNLNEPHPYAWMGRRERDIHDVWHILTGYRANEHLGEACLVAFSYAQTRGLGWAAIGLAAALKSIRTTRSLAFARAVAEGYRLGRRAAWLHGEDYEALFAEPIAAARARLRIGEPVRYRIAQAQLAELGIQGI